MDLALATSPPVEDNPGLMRHELKLHPETPCQAVRSLEVDLFRPEPSVLLLRYRLKGVTSRIRLPKPEKPSRSDGLWQSTCFEAFLRRAGQEGYLEFNFALSNKWAAYRFDSYREGMVPAETPAPVIAASRSESVLMLQARLHLGSMINRPVGHLGLCAVIEETSGNKSYWALAHPPGKPDFHHSDCFAAELPIAEGS